LTISLALGALFVYVIDEGMEAYVYTIAIMGFQTMFLLGSLAVVRGVGYRFVGRIPPPS
jgi:hypothetical protein